MITHVKSGSIKIAASAFLWAENSANENKICAYYFLARFKIWRLYKTK